MRIPSCPFRFHYIIKPAPRHIFCAAGEHRKKKERAMAQRDSKASGEPLAQEEKDQLKELGSARPRSGVKILSIIGEIEGHSVVPPQSKATKYEHVIPVLTDAEQDDQVQGILVIMNTIGGDVEAGLAIAELIRGMSKPSVSLVLGGGHSIGIPLAVAADRSFIAPTASMTVHPLRTTGLFINARQNFEYYTKMQERIVRFVCANSHIAEHRFTELMNSKNQLADDMGSVLIGAQAVEEGLIDSVGGLADALLCLKAMRGEKRAFRARERVRPV